MTASTRPSSLPLPALLLALTLGLPATAMSAKAVPEGRPGLWLEATRASLNGTAMPAALDAPGTLPDGELAPLRQALAGLGIPPGWQPVLRCHPTQPPGPDSVKQTLRDECPGVRFQNRQDGFDYRGQCEKHGGRSTINGQVKMEDDQHLTRRSTFEADVMGQSLRAETDTVMHWLSADCGKMPPWLQPQWLPALQAQP